MAKIDFDRSYGVSALLFDTSVEPFSPVFGDVERKVSYDEEGKEIISFVPVDYEKLNAERGPVENWNLDALLKAGIDPSFPIHTGSAVSRFEGVNDINNAALEVEKLFADENSKTE